MRIIFCFIGLIVAFSQAGCKKDTMCNCLDSTGSNSTEKRTVDAFSRIELYNNVDLVLHTDTYYHVNVTAGSHLINGIKTEVEDGILKLRNKNRCNWVRSFKNKFTVNVWIKSLDKITVHDASGNIDFADTLIQNEFRIDSWSSSGDYHLKLNCGTSTFALHTGPADLYAQGRVGVNYVYSAGYGKIDLLQTDADDIYITNKGTNDLYVNANKRIAAELYYTGNIYYRGNPTQVEEKYTGNGRLIHIN